MAKSQTVEETALVTINGDLAIPEGLVEQLEGSPSLQEIDGEDRMTPYYCFNVKLTDTEGKWYPPDVFFHTLTEDTKSQIDCVLLFLHKTNRYRTFDEKEGSKTLCRSLDCYMGVWQDTGDELLCKDCKYQRWTNQGAPPCKRCYNFVGVDLDDREPFIITAKSTSMTPAKRFLNHHFLKKLRGKDLPLYVYRTRLSLECPKGTYAVLQFDVIGQNTVEEIEAYTGLCGELLQSQRLDFTFEQPEEVEEEGSEPPF